MENKDFNIVDWELVARYHTGEATRDEREKLESWARLSPENQCILNGSELDWDASKVYQEVDMADLDVAWDKMHKRVNPKSHSKRVLMPVLFKVAASLVLLFCLSYLVYRIVQKPQGNFITQVANEQVREVILPDGSTVTLSRNSKLIYPAHFTANVREVQLEGLAFFDVKRNEKQPFIIRSGSAQVKVLGTSFEVDARNSELVEVTVKTGKVELSDLADASLKTYILAGEKASLELNVGKISNIKNTDRNYLAWKTQYLEFDQTELFEVARIIEKTYGAEITFSNNNLKNCRLTARFEKQPIDAVLHIIEATFNLKIQKQGGKIVIDGAACKQSK